MGAVLDVRSGAGLPPGLSVSLETAPHAPGEQLLWKNTLWSLVPTAEPLQLSTAGQGKTSPLRPFQAKCLSLALSSQDRQVSGREDIFLPLTSALSVSGFSFWGLTAVRDGADDSRAPSISNSLGSDSGDHSDVSLNPVWSELLEPTLAQRHPGPFLVRWPPSQRPRRPTCHLWEPPCHLPI